ncbi:MAG: Fe-S cluster assembly protein NifU [Candidatus Wallbacteria bacterium]
MWNYSDKVLDHFHNPRNYGEIEKPDAVGEVGSMACGDALRLTLKVDKTTDKILDAKFQTFGCGSAIASSSAMTELIKGMTLDEAAKLTNADISKYLDGLPPEKMHCSVMGKEALEAAIANYRGYEIKKDEEEGRLVCRCFGVTEDKIIKLAHENNLHTVEEITNYTKAGGGCGACLQDIQDILDNVWKNKKAEAVKPLKKEEGPKKLTTVQKIKLIEETFEKQIRPSLNQDGGDIELIDVVDNKVYVKLKGMCSHCPSSSFTIKSFVETKLKEFVENDIEVMEAQ